MFYVVILWVALLFVLPVLKRLRLADKFSLTRLPLTLVVLHSLTEVMGWTSSPAWCWPVPTKLGILWLAISCQLLSWSLDMLDGRVARDSKVGGTKWGRFVDATTDKLSTWPVALLLIFFFVTERGLGGGLLAWGGVYIPLILLALYDWGYSTPAHYKKAKSAFVKAEVDIGANRLGHIFGQVKHWSWCIMIGFMVCELLPVIDAHGASISNALAGFAKSQHWVCWPLLWLAVLSGAASMWVRKNKVGPDARPIYLSGAATSLTESSDEL